MNILDEISKLLKGKNGLVFGVVLVALLVWFFLRIMPFLIGFGVALAVVYFIFKAFDKK